jgi:hypothetical protein
MGQPTESHVSVSRAEFIGAWKPTGGSEPSQYPQEEKAIAIPSVAASERGTAQTDQVQSVQVLPDRGRGTLLESAANDSGSYKSPT